MNSAELQKYLKCADRFKLRKLMAECLPYAMHDMFYRKNVAGLLPHLDPVVADIFFSKLLELCTATARCVRPVCPRGQHACNKICWQGCFQTADATTQCQDFIILAGALLQGQHPDLLRLLQPVPRSGLLPGSQHQCASAQPGWQLRLCLHLPRCGGDAAAAAAPGGGVQEEAGTEGLGLLMSARLIYAGLCRQACHGVRTVGLLEACQRLVPCVP